MIKNDSSMQREAILYFVFAIILLICSWNTPSLKAVTAAHTLPDDVIRLRVFGHSDQPLDQWIKRKISKQVVAEIKQWNVENDGIEGKREQIESYLSSLQLLAENTLRENGFGYGATVELTTTSFPIKMFSGQIVPAGEYEALKISLGSGKGKNYWCVMFASLCVDSAVATADKTVFVDESKRLDDNSDGQPEIEVRFFLWDLLVTIIEWIKNLFV